MNKIKNATKRITAVGASALMVSSAAFGAGLSDYPSNFVDNGEFMGQVVVGSSAAAIDSTSAASIIDDLAGEFSGDSEKVEISYKSTSGGESVNVVKANSQLNYGETLSTTGVTETLDDGDIDFLEDGRFDNGKSDEDYTQEITVANGAFNHALRDNVDGVTEISDNLYFSNGQTYLTYVLEFDNAIPLSATNSENDDDFIGQTLTIMGNEFTIASITKATAPAMDKLELIGGANKVALGEGESTSITVDGKTYDIEVLNVDTESTTSKVLLTVNGKSKSIDEFDTEDISGVTIAVTDLVGSGRDSVKGYAEIVVGGQKVTLEDGGTEVQINEEDVSDLYDGYFVTSDFGTGGFDTITITYAVDDDVSLEAGDSLIDPLFQGFDLVFEGTNNPDFSEVKLSSSDDDITVEGTLINGNDFNRKFIHTEYDNTNTTGDTYLKGSQDNDRIFFLNSSTAINISNFNGITVNTANVTFNFANTGIKGSGIFVYDDEEQQYLYEISSQKTTDLEVSVDEVLDNKDKADLTGDEILTDLEVTLAASTNVSGTIHFDYDDLGDTLAFENELMMNFSGVETAAAIPSGVLTFRLDTGDVDVDETTDDAEVITVTLGWDTGSDDEFTLAVSSAPAFVNAGDADAEDDNNDVQEFVTVYGTKVVFDNDEKSYVRIMTPEDQVYAKVNLVTGGAGSTSGSVTVDADAADDKKAELEADGYTITGTSTVTSEEVEFDVTAPVMDSDVSGMDDMIVVGGPAVNSVAADLLGLSFPTGGAASGVGPEEAVVRYFESSNSVLVYGYEGKDTAAAAAELNEGGLTGSLVNVN